MKETGSIMSYTVMESFITATNQTHVKCTEEAGEKTSSLAKD